MATETQMCAICGEQPATDEFRVDLDRRPSGRREITIRFVKVPTCKEHSIALKRAFNQRNMSGGIVLIVLAVVLLTVEIASLVLMPGDNTVLSCLACVVVLFLVMGGIGIAIVIRSARANKLYQTYHPQVMSMSLPLWQQRAQSQFMRGVYSKKFPPYQVNEQTGQQ